MVSYLLSPLSRLPLTFTTPVEEAGVLSFAADNLDVLINLFGFIAIEPAKIAIPAVSQVTR